jgi:uncharacterized protein YceK
MRNLILTIAITSVITGCASTASNTPYEGYEDDYTAYDDTVSSNISIANEATLKEATEQVVMDLRGKRNAESYMNYQKTIVQCGVMIPGRIVGHSMITPTEGCIRVMNGAFIEAETLRLPLEGE